jgi:hypothetical protein
MLLGYPSYIDYVQSRHQKPNQTGRQHYCSWPCHRVLPHDHVSHIPHSRRTRASNPSSSMLITAYMNGLDRSCLMPRGPLLRPVDIRTKRQPEYLARSRIFDAGEKAEVECNFRLLEGGGFATGRCVRLYRLARPPARAASTSFVSPRLPDCGDYRPLFSVHRSSLFNCSEIW